MTIEFVRERLFKAKNGRHDAIASAAECRDYYEGRHRTALDIAESCKRDQIPWIVAMCPDPYVHVESQVTGDVPEFSFHGREESDEANAKSREAIVRYVLESDGYADTVATADRRCIIGGTAVWKVFWDGKEVRIANVDTACIYPDPNATDVEECEYIFHCYPMQRSLLARLYREELKRAGLDPARMPCDPLGAFEDSTEQEDTAVVTEYWYRDDDGDISCALYVGGKELIHTKNYWENTSFTCFPFVFQYRTRNSDSIWGIGDLEPILTLVDAVDRELSTAQLASAFSGNDVILAEHDAFSTPPTNRPGAVWELKPGAMGKVARLGGSGDSEDRTQMIKLYRSLIQEAVGNFDADMGREPVNITSATGFAQLIERSELRKATKKAERLGAFRRLLALIDRTALEFYDKRRTVYIGAGTADVKRVEYDPTVLRGKDGYFPEVDTVISTGDGMHSSKAFMLGAIDTVMSHTIDSVNYPLAAEALSLAGINDAQKIRTHFERLLGGEVTDDE